MGVRHRSPAYPSITIDEAVERAHVLYKKEGKHPALVRAAAAHWGYKPKSSGGLTVISALKAYGLLIDEGSGTDRKVRLSDDGMAIARDEREVSPERDLLIANLALKPKILLEMWSTYGTELPSEDTVKHFLVVGRGYNPSAVGDIIKVYQAATDRHASAILSGFDDISDEQDDIDGESSASMDGKIPMKQDTFTLDEGTVTIQWPSRLSKASFDDLNDWLEIMTRKMKRAVVSESGEQEDNG